MREYNGEGVHEVVGKENEQIYIEVTKRDSDGSGHDVGIRVSASCKIAFGLKTLETV